MLKKIIKNLETGNYRIEYREQCECRFDWCLDNGKLVCDAMKTDGDCWFDNALVMDDLAGQCNDELSVGSDGVIAINDPYFGLAVSWLNASCDAEQEIVDAIKNSDAYQKLTSGRIYLPDNNDLHNRRKRESLVKWLSDNKHLQTYVYYPGDFANEYVCVLLALPHHYFIDNLQIPAHWNPKSAEEWAEMFLQKDTDGTRYDIGFQLVNELYEIDYCWYDRHAGATVSHDTERYYFVDLQAAEIFLDTLDPESIRDCYELNKLSVDYDGEIMEIDYITTKWETKVEK